MAFFPVKKINPGLEEWKAYLKKKTQKKAYLEFASDEHSSAAQQLQLLFLNASTIQIQIEQLDAQVQDLMIEFELLLHLHHPVDQEQTHLFSADTVRFLDRYHLILIRFSGLVFATTD